MNTRNILACTLGLLMVAPVLAAQQVKSGENKISVVELYTSEGCSSCPPADEFLSKLGNAREAGKILPLAFHVDYWDYIGWKDPYAQAQYTQRQRQIARANQQASVYTPEFVVDGEEARGSRGITGKVSSTYNSQAEADITLDLPDADHGSLVAQVSIDNIRYSGDEIPEVTLVIYESGLSSSINAGENQGKTLVHDYVVRYLSLAQPTQSGKQHAFKVQLNPGWDVSALGVAAFVKLSDSGGTLQAVKTTL